MSDKVQAFSDTAKKAIDNYRKLYAENADGITALRKAGEEAKQELNKRIDKAIAKHEKLYRQHQEHWKAASEEARKTGDAQLANEAVQAFKKALEDKDIVSDLAHALQTINKHLLESNDEE